MYLDKHNNYFTLMMLIIGIPVNLSSRLHCNMSVMGVIENSRNNTTQSEI